MNISFIIIIIVIINFPPQRSCQVFGVKLKFITIYYHNVRNTVNGAQGDSKSAAHLGNLTASFLTVLPSVAAVKSVAVEVWNRASLRPVEELFLISFMAILFIHDFFVCLVLFPEGWILDPFDL